MSTPTTPRASAASNGRAGAAARNPDAIVALDHVDLVESLRNPSAIARPRAYLRPVS